jgi:hippurate hydrolase
MIPANIDVEALVALRRDLHAHPETAFEEHRTAEIVAKKLESLGIAVHRGLAGTGVVGILSAGTSLKAIGLRADMDALPIEEANRFPHASTVPGKMHACGHDGHTAMLLGAAEALAKAPAFDGTVVFIFQPAEEGGGGANKMIEDGLFERFPVDAVYGLHNWPELPAGVIAARAGPVMASTCRLEIDVEGQGGHAAMPHLCHDTVLAASTLVAALQSTVSRAIPPTDSAVVSITGFHAGDTWNVLPARAHLFGTIRVLDFAVQKKVETAISRICEGIGQTFGLSISPRFDYRYPPTANSPAEAAQCLAAARKAVGEANVFDNLPPSMGAEDFSFMLKKCPGCYAWLGSARGEGDPKLHNPAFDFNDAILETGVRYWLCLVQEILGKA